MNLDLLVFAPHPDDAELGAGGILATHARLGYRVGVVDLTRGEMGTNGTPEERAAEAAVAARLLGLAVRDSLGLPDACLREEEEAVGQVVDALRSYRPRWVLAPYEKDPHPDHRAAHQIVTAAVYKAGLRKYRPDLPPHRPFRFAYYFLNTEAPPSVVVDVSAVYPIKEAALRAYHSQFQRSENVGEATRLNDPRFLQKVQARDAYWGTLIGTAYGEGLLFSAPLGLADLTTF